MREMKNFRGMLSKHAARVYLLGIALALVCKVSFAWYALNSALLMGGCLCLMYEGFTTSRNQHSKPLFGVARALFLVVSFGCFLFMLVLSAFNSLSKPDYTGRQGNLICRGEFEGNDLGASIHVIVIKSYFLGLQHRLYADDLQDSLSGDSHLEGCPVAIVSGRVRSGDSLTIRN
jgi:hypothetical protein